MTKKQYHAIGLMSGSSLDGLDIAWCRFDLAEPESTTFPISDWELLKAETLPLSETWVTRLANLPQQNGLTFSKTHTYFGHYMAELVNAFLAKHQIEPDFIASHGHTVFHHPEKLMTSQIGDGAALAALTGYPVVSGFRTQDLALHGEGAPIAPIADRFLFNGYDFYMNIGGIVNITSQTPNKTIAFDIAPANQILNQLANTLGQAYDHNGQIAATGEIDANLMTTLNNNPYFQKSYPKSLDNQWVLQEVLPIYLASDAAVNDKLHTACHHMALQTAQSIDQIIAHEKLNKKQYRMLVTGGGALNVFLMECLQKHCNEKTNITIVLPDIQIIQFKEAALMALMGLLRVCNLPNCIATVTGAKRDSIGGAIYQGHKKQI